MSFDLAACAPQSATAEATKKNRRQPIMNSFRFIDLFAGLGGFHIALERIGGRCVFAAEWKDHLRDLYEANFGLRPAGDIKKVAPEAIPDHDVLTAGFPCQPFSKAGEQKGFECTEQGNLFFNVEAILRAKQPKYFILENVPNLLNHDGGRTWQHIQDLLGLQGLGYDIRATRYSPHEFGIPQIRERVYIVGSRKGLHRFEWPAPLKLETSIESVLDCCPSDAKQLSPQVQDCLTQWNKFVKQSPRSLELPSFPLWSMEWGADYPFEDTTPYAIKTTKGMRGLCKFRGSHGQELREFSGDERWMALPSHARTEQIEFPKWKKDFIRQNRLFYAENKSWIDAWIPNILRFPSSLQKFEWNVHGEKKDIWNYVLQFRASGVRVKRRNTAPSLIAMTDTQVPIIGWERRYMTPRECARLQSLHELKALPDSNTRAFQALGNAVNADVVETVARALLKKTHPEQRKPMQNAQAVRAGRAIEMTTMDLFACQ
ncbi:DNA (cytosine-5-)-methyltransferase [Paraburkholderia mimosarum]|uniref:DNA (cytosine-5-)-methyltransferase n=1 Tax=Paraburkholderia mimosarum TaxID=312026 RepID=UPI0039C300EC